jgi:hypothetical protein
MSKPLEEYMPYVPLLFKEKYERVQGLLKFLEKYTKKYDLTSHNIEYNKNSLFEIVDRLNKRNVYFRMFYKKAVNGMSERNEAALLCFWILKFAPFFDTTDPKNPININFAVFVLLSGIKYDCFIRKICLTVPDAYTDVLKYAFRYRDISKEAVMAIAETVIMLGDKRKIES